MSRRQMSRTAKFVQRAVARTDLDKRHVSLRSGLLLVLMAAVIDLAPRAFAQTVVVQPTSVLKRMSVEQLLQQEVVSVTRNPEPLGEAPSSVFLIPGQGAYGSG